MKSYSEASISYFHDDLKRRTRLLGSVSTLEQAAQIFAGELFSDFDSSVLVRVYTTIPYEKLPPSPRAFADQIARSAGVAAEVRDDTMVLCLMGTKGKRPEWGDRRRSKGHLAIPLVSRKFVQAIPMITRLLNEFGIGTDWLDQPDKTRIITRSMGRIATVFYVPDAATFRDNANRLVIPASDFVTQNNVQTVFGVGGAYANGYICTVLFFLSERLDRSVVDGFLPIINFFKHATTTAAMSGHLFTE
jgi:hypothetical protein